MRRVVITGVGSISPLGGDVETLLSGIEQGKSAIRYIQEWEEYTGLRCHLGAPAPLPHTKNIPRKNRRSMGRMSFFAVEAAKQALANADIGSDTLASGRAGCIIGSTMGGAESLVEAFELMLPEHDLTQLSSTKFFQCVSHTAVMNVAQYLGINGVVMATSGACASALQAMGAGYDQIRLGRQDVMLCGGAEEIHPAVTGSFDILFATSTHYEDHPDKTPRPFDRDRDGLICGEGSGILVLEEYERAMQRGATPLAEVTGFHTCGSGSHISQSDSETMQLCINKSLEDAGINTSDIDYINAHATATIQGDQHEADVIRHIFGDKIPVSSLKGYIGHTLGASGAIELIVSLYMLQNNLIYPTLNLDNIGRDCEGLNHVTQKQDARIDTVLKNAFAFGGINSSIIVNKPE
ncbi:MAG: beta-ketoacyl-[acyl-carrier-protein] synthase family protein [Thermodesulfobacteriota bacterium]